MVSLKKLKAFNLQNRIKQNYCMEVNVFELWRFSLQRSN